VPDTEPDTAPDTAPGVGDPVPVDEPIGWFQVLWILVPLFLSLLWPLIVGGLLFWGYKYWMNKYRPKCDICGVAATVYNAKKAKPYLNQAQQIEVDLDSVFYSVAICPQCTRRKVLRFAAPNRLVTQCPRCYYKTMAITQQTTTQKPTSERDGEAIIHRTCRHCGYSATSPEVLSANTKGKSEGLDAFLDDDLGLGRLRQGYRDPREVEPRPPDDRNNGADNSL
jgi:Zn ribbon nucleic-acid-binding protein